MLKTKTTRQTKNALKSYWTTSVLVLVNLFVIGALLFMMTKSDNQSANIANATQRISDLSIQNQTLQEKIADAQSIDNVTQKANALGMVPASDILYVQTSGVYSDNLH